MAKVLHKSLTSRNPALRCGGRQDDRSEKSAVPEAIYQQVSGFAGSITGMRAFSLVPATGYGGAWMSGRAVPRY